MRYKGDSIEERAAAVELARMRHIERVYERTATLSGALQSSGSGTLAGEINSLRGP